MPIPKRDEWCFYDKRVTDSMVRSGSMMTKIKICGLRRPEDIEAVNRLKPDYCGFIVNVPKSRRTISVKQLRELTGMLCKDVIPVGVFVDHSPELIAELLNEQVIRIAQLHGQEDEDYIRYLRTLTPFPLIKAFSVREQADAQRALSSPADYILLDQGSGGTGQTFDWTLVPKITRAWFLAGGLSADNVDEAVARLHPWAVDLSSAVETDGWKDPQKMERIIAKIRTE